MDVVRYLPCGLELHSDIRIGDEPDELADVFLGDGLVGLSLAQRQRYQRL